jgi:shikimate kinase
VASGERLVFLVGFMASGKTTVGRLLAAELGYGFVDTDERVEHREGRSVDRVFAESGEGHFRRVEWEVLQGLVELGPTVVATGGGLFLGYRQRRWMIERGPTVWLDVPFEIARRRAEAERSTAQRGRPLMKSGDPTALRTLFDRRRASYFLARFRVDASGPAEDVARSVAGLLGRA